ncbi:MAG: type IX secretion system protein PorQ, partial [Paramuribaculum sp.]|nr:type IX secretion system protein PorQ [Paramuribaculum sp.]
MNIIRYIAFACLLTFSHVPALCDDGSSAYNFLNITSSPRIYGLGGVNISSTDAGLLATDQNPALLGQEHSTKLALSYMRYIGSSNFASIAYSHAAGERGAWAASLHYFGYGTMDRLDASGVNIGSFSPKDVAFSGLYSHDFTERIRGGFAIKALYSAYDSYTAFALGVDLGINYYDEERDLSLSATVVNLGGQIKRFNERYDRLPIDMRLGWTQSFPGFPVRFSVTTWNLTKWNLPYYHTGDGSLGDKPELKSSFMSNLFRHLIFGADIVPSDNFHISLGYNYKTRTDMSTYNRNFLSGWS